MAVSPYYYKPSDAQKAEIAAASARIKRLHAQRKANAATAERVLALLPTRDEPVDNPFINSNFTDL